MELKAERPVLKVTDGRLSGAAGLEACCPAFCMLINIRADTKTPLDIYIC